MKSTKVKHEYTKEGKVLNFFYKMFRGKTIKVYSNTSKDADDQIKAFDEIEKIYKRK